MAHGIGLPLTLIDALSVGAGVALLGAGGRMAWRAGRGGKALLTLRRPAYAWLYTALAGLFIAILLARLLTPHLRQPSVVFLNLAWVAFCLAYIAHRPRVHEKGIVAGALFLPWERIESYTVDVDVDVAHEHNRGRPHALLTISHYPSPGLSTKTRSTAIRCAAAKRPEIELLLARHVRTEHGHRRWHARRVGASSPSSMSAVPGL